MLQGTTRQHADTIGADFFAATDADTHGGYGNIQLRRSGADAYLTDWKNPAWRIEYQIKTDKAGKWMVEAEVAVPEPAKLTLHVKKASTPVEIPATGAGLTWKTMELGVMELPAGETGFEVKAVSENWKGLSVRRVRLIPVR